MYIFSSSIPIVIASNLKVRGKHAKLPIKRSLESIANKFDITIKI